MLIICVAHLFLVFCIHFCHSNEKFSCNGKKSTTHEEFESEGEFCGANFVATDVKEILDRIDGHILDIKQVCRH